MRFVGCALAWRPGETRDRASCLVVLDERGSIIANSFAADAGDSCGDRGLRRRAAGRGRWRDAPLAVPNERGTRRIERILSKVALPAYSASRKMFGGEPYSEELLAQLEEWDRVHGLPFPRTRGQRVVTEVDSAAALKILALERTARDGEPSWNQPNGRDPRTCCEGWRS